MKAYTLTIEHELCWGCKTCEVACKQENRSTDGIKLISVTEDELEQIMIKFNHRPRKCLDFKSPFEVFFEQSVALTI